MPKDINLIELKSMDQKKRILKILEKSNCINYYMLEGLSSENKNYRDFLYIKNRETLAAIHLKYNKYLHIRLLNPNQKEAELVAKRIFIDFGKLKSIFGERSSIQKIVDVKEATILKDYEYIFMELERKNFKPVTTLKYRDIVNIKPQDAYLILPLLVSYEIEELEIEPEKLKPEVITKYLAYKIMRDEITVIGSYIEPIGIAGVNAKYRDTCQIGSVYIKKSFRGKGYGTQLLTYHLFKLFKSYRRVVLFVRDRNKKAISLYKKLGFIEKGKLKQIILDY